MLPKKERVWNDPVFVPEETATTEAKRGFRAFLRFVFVTEKCPWYFAISEIMYAFLSIVTTLYFFNYLAAINPHMLIPPPLVYAMWVLAVLQCTLFGIGWASIKFDWLYPRLGVKL